MLYAVSKAIKSGRQAREYKCKIVPKMTIISKFIAATMRSKVIFITM
jgi:hypothetical protein